MDWATTSYAAFLNDEGTGLVRVRLQIVRGSVLRFTVQYDVQIDDRWFPVVRYDTAHGFAHRDRLDRRGQSVEKLYLGLRDRYPEIVTNAIDDIRSNWMTYRDEFTGRDS